MNKRKAEDAAAKTNAILMAKLSKAAPPLPEQEQPPPPPPEERPKTPPPIHEERRIRRGFEIDPDSFTLFDDEYVVEVDLNETRNRYMVTRKEKREELELEYDVKVELKGKYYPKRSMATERDPPLHLLVTGKDKERMAKCLTRIKDLLERRLDFLGDKLKGFFLEERVYVDIDASSDFGLRGRLAGNMGAYLKYINAVTNCRLTLRGKGSLYKEENGTEGEEPLYIHISSPTTEGMDRAKELAKDLIKTVREQYQQWKEITLYQSIQTQLGYQGYSYTPEQAAAMGYYPPPVSADGQQYPAYPTADTTQQYAAYPPMPADGQQYPQYPGYFPPPDTSEQPPPPPPEQ